MSEQLEAFDEIAEQMNVAVNPGTKVGAGPGWRYRGLSPSMLRAKAARPAAEAPAASAAAPEALPKPVRESALLRPAPGRVLYTRSDLIAALRERKEALNLSHETVDAITGWPDRFSSKVLSPLPRRGLTGATLQIVLDALGLGIAAVVLVEDPEQSEKMRPRWKARGVSGPRPMCVVAECSELQGDCDKLGESP